MFMYERRIGLSMTRILQEFKKQQIIHQLEQQEQTIHNPMNDSRDEAVTRTQNSNLKKQSQFSPDMMGANPFMTKEYGDFPAAVRAENKANLYPDQSPFDAPSPSELLRKSHNISAKSTG
jgi:hypothetical protein